ncbi:MAG: phosphopyruvate hydratase [Candidatus Kerfeldbacteria bacterium]|nr:phosphopyruvate hydratase [Candidatus Kerfeldbacteria bacterium]
MNHAHTIKSIHAREVLDSRGNPTIAALVTLTNGAAAEAMVPSGASTGAHEAVELRDGDTKRFGGLGVLQAVRHVNTVIAKALRGQDVLHHRQLDAIMLRLDGTRNKAKLGANAILAVSLATARVGAVSTKRPLYQHIRRLYGLRQRGWILPYPLMNIVNGGKHADNGLEFQEFMIVPQARRFTERIRQGAEVFHALKNYLHSQGLATAVGDEGGFAPQLKNNEAALRAIRAAVQQAGYRFGQDIKIALDPASSEFYNATTGQYTVDGKAISPATLNRLYARWAKTYHIISIEDGLAEDDWDNWREHTALLGKRLNLVGDDLFVTNVERLQAGINQGVANAILIKVNQIGTLSETLATIALAQQHHYAVVVSHRSGETEDTTIADLSVAVNAEYIKTGSLSRSDRVAKYNRLLAIAEQIKLLG